MLTVVSIRLLTVASSIQ